MYNYGDDAPTNQYPVNDIPDAMGYALIAYTDDGDMLCEVCVRESTNPVHKSEMGEYTGDGWGVIGWGHSGDTDTCFDCGHCNKVLS